MKLTLRTMAFALCLLTAGGVSAQDATGAIEGAITDRTAGAIAEDRKSVV